MFFWLPQFLLLSFFTNSLWRCQAFSENTLIPPYVLTTRYKRVSPLIPTQKSSFESLEQYNSKFKSLKYGGKNRGEIFRVFLSSSNNRSRHKRLKRQLKNQLNIFRKKIKIPPERYRICNRIDILTNDTVYYNKEYIRNCIRLPVCPTTDFFFLDNIHPFHPIWPPPLFSRFTKFLRDVGFAIVDIDISEEARKNLLKEEEEFKQFMESIKHMKEAGSPEYGKDGNEFNYYFPYRKMELYENYRDIESNPYVEVMDMNKIDVQDYIERDNPIPFYYLLNSADTQKNKKFSKVNDRKVVLHPFFGDPIYPAESYNELKQFFAENPSHPMINATLLCDVIKCRSDGLIMSLQEDVPLFAGEPGRMGHDDFEPRFVIQTERGYVKKNNLKIGDNCGLVGESSREKIFNNPFAMPKKYRRPIELPNGEILK